MGKGGRGRDEDGGLSGMEALRSRNVTIAGRRTSIRLEPSMWSAFDEIAALEHTSVSGLCSRIEERLEAQARGVGKERKRSDVTLTSAVRVFITMYFKRAATPEGHSRAGHGTGDPFHGTPLELPAAKAPSADDDGRGPSTGSGGLARAAADGGMGAVV